MKTDIPTVSAGIGFHREALSLSLPFSLNYGKESNGESFAAWRKSLFCSGVKVDRLCEAPVLEPHPGCSFIPAQGCPLGYRPAPLQGAPGSSGIVPSVGVKDFVLAFAGIP